MGTPMRPVSSPTCPDGHFEAPLTGLMKVRGFDLRTFDDKVIRAMNETISKAVLVWASHTGDTVPEGRVELKPTIIDYIHKKLDKDPDHPASAFAIHSHMLVKYGFSLKFAHGPFFRTRGGIRIPFETLWLRLPCY